MPDHVVVPSEVSTAWYNGYVYRNKSTFLKGLGFAMKIVKKADESKGPVLVKYGLWRLSNNQIGLQAGLDTDLKTFYDDASTWVSEKKTSVQYDGVTLTATTDALGGASDKLYRFDVHIGVEDHRGQASFSTIQGAG